MYKFIHFTVQDKEYIIPPSVVDHYISNPDVEHHDAYAKFIIDGKPIECYLALITLDHFEKEGDSFIDTMVAALVPTDGRDAYYLQEDASNFDEVVGKNTDYTIDPEKCMADNFALAITFGTAGPDGKGYQSPEIIDSIIEYLKK